MNALWLGVLDEQQPDDVTLVPDPLLIQLWTFQAGYRAPRRLCSGAHGRDPRPCGSLLVN